MLCTVSFMDPVFIFLKKLSKNSKICSKLPQPTVRLFNFLVSPLFFALPPENSENVSSPHIPDNFFFDFQPDTDVSFAAKGILDKIKRNKQTK